MRNNPSKHSGPNADRMPVEQVSWEDCQEFVRRINAKTPGGGFRLPTEAEWEYATRAAGDNQALAAIAWYRDSVPQPTAGYRQLDSYSTREVGLCKPNRWGFYDMLGNVWEWSSSAERPYPFDAKDGREGDAASEQHVVRGGGFADGAETLDPAVRHGEKSTRRYRWNGLRLARSIPGGVQ